MTNDERTGQTRQLKLQTARLSWRKIDGEILALDLEQSTYLSANSSAVLLWGALVEGTSFDDLVGRLVDAFEIDVEQAAGDVESFLEDLQLRGLLVDHA